MHFYLLQALDWVSVVKALEADPKAASAFAQSISGYARSSPDYFSEIQQRLRSFASGQRGQPENRRPPEVDLVVMAHYLAALAWQRRIVALMTPALTDGGMRKVTALLALMREFVAQVYLPDLLAIGAFSKDGFAGSDGDADGDGKGNFLSYGDFPNAAVPDPATFLVPRGAILNRDLSTIHEVDLASTRSPHWNGRAMETGPLARVLMMYATGHASTVSLVDQSLGRLRLPFEALYSVMGRHLARAFECQILTDALPAWGAERPVNF